MIAALSQGDWSSSFQSFLVGICACHSSFRYRERAAPPPSIMQRIPAADNYRIDANLCFAYEKPDNVVGPSAAAACNTAITLAYTALEIFGMPNLLHAFFGLFGVQS
ncbi:hypothetical protein NLG97_g4934 [Lecanicillium saksenae]|uniref:Uncharacterized protein n=1 Tax=Lecanicillium saksenae TaxID=468837 RepID=A0ACC1QWF5_9HYPO|nr:hypothetical protein NLG97_g4934 [Lecanicillium saksenae]